MHTERIDNSLMKKGPPVILFNRVTICNLSAVEFFEESLRGLKKSKNFHGPKNF